MFFKGLGFRVQSGLRAATYQKLGRKGAKSRSTDGWSRARSLSISCPAAAWVLSRGFRLGMFPRYTNSP